MGYKQRTNAIAKIKSTTAQKDLNRDQRRKLYAQAQNVLRTLREEIAEYKKPDSTFSDKDIYIEFWDQTIANPGKEAVIDAFLEFGKKVKFKQKTLGK